MKKRDDIKCQKKKEIIREKIYIVEIFGVEGKYYVSKKASII